MKTNWALIALISLGLWLWGKKEEAKAPAPPPPPAPPERVPPAPKPPSIPVVPLETPTAEAWLAAGNPTAAAVVATYGAAPIKALAKGPYPPGAEPFPQTIAPYFLVPDLYGGWSPVTQQYLDSPYGDLPVGASWDQIWRASSALGIEAP